MGTITDGKGNVVGEFADTLEDWKQAAEVEAGIRREFQAEITQMKASLEAARPAFENLGSNQRQLDMDGCEVGVSRQAVEETLDGIYAALGLKRDHKP